MHAMTKSVPQPSTNKHAALVAQACRRIEASEQPPSLDDLAMHAGQRKNRSVRAGGRA